MKSNRFNQIQEGLRRSPVFSAGDGLVVDCQNNRTARAAGLDSAHTNGAVRDVAELCHVRLELVDLELGDLCLGQFEFFVNARDLLMRSVDLIGILHSHNIWRTDNGGVVIVDRLHRDGGVGVGTHLGGLGFGTFGWHVL
jgi:hypothetical protein